MAITPNYNEFAYVYRNFPLNGGTSIAHRHSIGDYEKRLYSLPGKIWDLHIEGSILEGCVMFGGVNVHLDTDTFVYLGVSPTKAIKILRKNGIKCGRKFIKALYSDNDVYYDENRLDYDPGTMTYSYKGITVKETIARTKEATA